MGNGKGESRIEKRFAVFIYRDAQIVRLAFRYGMRNWGSSAAAGEGLLTGKVR